MSLVLLSNDSSDCLSGKFLLCNWKGSLSSKYTVTQCTAFKMTAQIDYLASFYSATRSEVFQQNCGRNCSLDLPSGSSSSEVISGKFLWFNQKLNLSSK